MSAEPESLGVIMSCDCEKTPAVALLNPELAPMFILVEFIFHAFKVASQHNESPENVPVAPTVPAGPVKPVDPVCPV